MPARLTASELRTCLGDGPQTFAALLTGRSGIGALRHGEPSALNVTHGYHLDDGAARAFAASRWVADCARRAIATAGLDPRRRRMVALVGTGLRELAAVEAYATGGPAVPAHRLHFGDAVRAAVPGLSEVVTVSNACSAGGHALALAEDLLTLGDAEAVLVCGVDATTESMLAMIGRVVDRPTDAVRPFDADRQGVLLGDGAAAVVLVPDDDPRPALARIVATGLSCDAHHETAPSVSGIARAMRDALTRGGRNPSEVDLVVAHGTGTALNDPAECEAIRQVLVAGGADPLVTAVKGATGHTSGAAALVNLDVAQRCLAAGRVPPVVGLRRPLPEGTGLRFATTTTGYAPRLVQCDAFGFGGVNAVTLVEAP
ncbi:3-oxoacyl-[acyl-carrier-protein] synthase II [Micromonospora phaseoli]|uniref:3-oxoacyl-[acyl-carrier-protein] synthase II n=1 Tax=Micromonospora phaseoli TaxID=1144548 RepID=A0A1H6Y8X7_9ACTN|nr:beta-ketoacyl synthase N-terminal-like domain-containing protein [Micromonospora phaseoli]PZW00084.1 3-oxoacyl-[acyl-carrier-protein] synthase II [Micromonospora phaseoli]GIJ79594.1 3-oxoacyl-ACP synthase [Micromonospora phaseoli]SEJ37691.1 3-oxoacyl-[acyl-carrier-protein] synthase II [Micromonospora phaseoli]